MLTINKELSIAIGASLAAGEVIMEVYDTAFDVVYKEDESPLTEADERANAIISDHLSQLDIPVISEESKQIDYEERRHWNQCWVVDPVDGTKEFIKRNGEFTVNIAMVVDGKPLLGIIYVPVTKTLYVADVIQDSAFKADLESHQSTIQDVIEKAEPLQPLDSGDKLVHVVGSRSHMNSETMEFVDALKKEGKQVEIVSRGSSLKFCLVAEGKANVYPRFAPTMEWDTAAGQAICNAVGVEVISQETNKPLLYNKKNLLNPWFLVSKK